MVRTRHLHIYACSFHSLLLLLLVGHRPVLIHNKTQSKHKLMSAPFVSTHAASVLSLPRSAIPLTQTYIPPNTFGLCREPLLFSDNKTPLFTTCGAPFLWLFPFWSQISSHFGLIIEPVDRLAGTAVDYFHDRRRTNTLADSPVNCQSRQHCDVVCSVATFSRLLAQQFQSVALHRFVGVSVVVFEGGSVANTVCSGSLRQDLKHRRLLGVSHLLRFNLLAVA